MENIYPNKVINLYCVNNLSEVYQNLHLDRLLIQNTGAADSYTTTYVTIFAIWFSDTVVTLITSVLEQYTHSFSIILLVEAKAKSVSATQLCCIRTKMKC